MKKAVSLILALMLLLSLCACGAEGGSGTSQMSKEDMLSSAESVDMKDFTDAVDNNIVSAKQLYCGKVLEVTGVVGEIKEDHIALVYESTYSGKIIDVYLSRRTGIPAAVSEDRCRRFDGRYCGNGFHNGSRV